MVQAGEVQLDGPVPGQRFLRLPRIFGSLRKVALPDMYAWMGPTATIAMAVTTRISASPRCSRHSDAIVRSGMSFQPAWTRMPARAGSGMSSRADGSSAR